MPQDVDGDVEDALSMVAALLGGEDVDVDGLSEETLDRVHSCSDQAL